MQYIGFVLLIQLIVHAGLSVERKGNFLHNIVVYCTVGWFKYGTYVEYVSRVCGDGSAYMMLLYMVLYVMSHCDL